MHLFLWQDICTVRDTQWGQYEKVKLVVPMVKCYCCWDPDCNPFPLLELSPVFTSLLDIDSSQHAYCAGYLSHIDYPLPPSAAVSAFSAGLIDLIDTEGGVGSLPALHHRAFSVPQMVILMETYHNLWTSIGFLGPINTSVLLQMITSLVTTTMVTTGLTTYTLTLQPTLSGSTRPLSLEEWIHLLGQQIFLASFFFMNGNRMGILRPFSS